MSGKLSVCMPSKMVPGRLIFQAKSLLTGIFVYYMHGYCPPRCTRKYHTLFEWSNWSIDYEQLVWLEMMWQ